MLTPEDVPPYCFTPLAKRRYQPELERRIRRHIAEAILAFKIYLNAVLGLILRQRAEANPSTG
jgi:hypothetical protein